MINRILLAAVAGLGLLLGSAASAGVERLPLAGGPAFVVDVPDGWSVSRDDEGNLLVVSADHTAVIVLNMATQDGAAGVDLSKFAAAALSEAKAQPYSRTEPATIGGLSGQAFYTTMNNATVSNIQVREVLAKVDATHIASESMIRAPGITATMDRAANDILATIRIVRR